MTDDELETLRERFAAERARIDDRRSRVATVLSTASAILPAADGEEHLLVAISLRLHDRGPGGHQHGTIIVPVPAGHSLNTDKDGLRSLIDLVPAGWARFIVRDDAGGMPVSLASHGASDDDLLRRVQVLEPGWRIDSYGLVEHLPAWLNGRPAFVDVDGNGRIHEIKVDG